MLSTWFPTTFVAKQSIPFIRHFHGCLCYRSSRAIDRPHANCIACCMHAITIVQLHIWCYSHYSTLPRMLHAWIAHFGQNATPVALHTMSRSGCAKQHTRLFYFCISLHQFVNLHPPNLHQQITLNQRAHRWSCLLLPLPNVTVGPSLALQCVYLRWRSSSSSRCTIWTKLQSCSLRFSDASIRHPIIVALLSWSFLPCSTLRKPPLTSGHHAFVLDALHYLW